MIDAFFLIKNKQDWRLKIYFLMVLGVLFSLPLNKDKGIINNLAQQSSDYLTGIDVSHHQGAIDWRKVKLQDVNYAIVKATEGATFVDEKFEYNWRKLNDINMTRGAYHFFHSAVDPIEQAANYLAVIGELHENDLPPIVDVEVADSNANETNEFTHNLLIFLAIIEWATRRVPILYTNQDFGHRYLQSKRLSRYTLWIAEYSETLGPLPPPWATKGWAIWQYSKQGKIDGILTDVDLNRFRGNAEQLHELIALSKY
mgnify:CR=1 FL=1